MKKTGDIRWAVDYRALNGATVADTYPLPSIAESLERLSGAEIFSCLDAASTYNVIPVEEESREKLAFISPFGCYTYKRMPFGAKNSGACYARFIGRCLEELGSPYLIAYLDDLLIFTKRLPAHLQTLRQVLQMHRDAGIKIKASKTKLFQRKITYLGHRVSKEGIEMEPSYVQRIVQWPTPSTVKQLNTLLGFMGYYQNFIPRYSELTAKMNGQRRQTRLSWSEDLERDFQQLKGEFAKSPVRGYPVYDRKIPFEVTTDFSAGNLAGILSQVQGGQEKFIAATGRKTSPHESNYGSTKGELAALVHCLRKWEHILKFAPFIVNTDSAALKHLQTMKNPKGIFFRWLEELSEFRFEVKHRPGKLNRNADSLSRCDHLPTKQEDEQIEAIQEEELNLRNIGKGQQDDPTLIKIREWIISRTKPSKLELRGETEELHQYANLLPQLLIDERNLLVRNTKLEEWEASSRKQLLIPSNLRNSVFKWCHEHRTAGHFGMTATVYKVQQRFFWPGMRREIQQKVTECVKCIEKIRSVPSRGTQHVPGTTGYVGEKLNIDLVGPLPTTPDGYRYVLTMQDNFSRHVSAVPLKTKEAVEVARNLIDRYIAVYGCPLQVHSDNGTEFKNKVWGEVMKKLRIQQTFTPPYNPSSNQVERFHRVLNNMLRIYGQKNDYAWIQCLSAMF